MITLRKYVLRALIGIGALSLLVTGAAQAKVEGKTIVMVEQNAKRGLEFADIGYVMVSGTIAIAGSGDELLENPDVGRLFLGG
jgi:ABC-type branched-subunit amino acid transport system ATPase component